MARATSPAITSGESGLNRYRSEIRKFPMLAPDEEYVLAKRHKEHGDRDAVHRLVSSHLRLVAKIATGYRGYGLPLGEVISEGNVGLMYAMKRFDPDKGFRLTTYAMWRLADDPTSLEELSNELRISRERVRQIEVRAFAKVKAFLTNARQPERPRNKLPLA